MSPPTSSPSDRSSEWCGQSGHTTPMEDSDKGECTLDFGILIWNIDTVVRLLKQHDLAKVDGQIRCIKTVMTLKKGADI